MATTKKTATRAAKAVKKTSTKKVAPKPRSDYKKGARVEITLRSGAKVKTFVESVKETQTGPFIMANIGTKQLPVIKGFRPAAVRGF